jgi:hypothetical protein
MLLRPYTLILPNGDRFRIRAQLTGVTGAKAKVGRSGVIQPKSQVGHNLAEFAGFTGTSAGTGAIVGGPAGALIGSVLGAGVVTVHLWRSDPQATLKAGTVLSFTLTDRLSLLPMDSYHDQQGNF